MFAANGGHEEIVNRLIQVNVNVNLQTKVKDITTLLVVTNV